VRSHLGHLLGRKGQGYESKRDGQQGTSSREQAEGDVGDEQAALPGGCVRFSHQRIGRRDGVAV